MGLSPSRHSVNTVSVRISNSVRSWSPTLVAHLGRRLPERLHRAAPYNEGAGCCALHRPAQAPMYERHRLHPHLGEGTLLQGAASCVPLGAPAQALPFPQHLGRSPHWPTHPLFRNTDKRRMPSIIRASSLSTQRWAGGPHSVSHCPLSDGPQVHTLHSVMAHTLFHCPLSEARGAHSVT